MDTTHTKTRLSPGWKIALGCLGILGVGTVAGGGACLLLLSKAGERQASERASLDGSVAVRVTADQLVSEYKGNEIVADGRYKDRLVEVSGPVSTIKKGAFGTPFLTLSTGRQSEFREVSCFLVNEDDANALSPGLPVIVRGKGAGLMGNVLLRPCKVVDQSVTSRPPASPGAAGRLPELPSPRALEPSPIQAFRPRSATREPAPTPPPVLALLEQVRFGDLAVSIDDYHVTHACPGNQGGAPADGAVFMIVYATAGNMGDNAVNLPHFAYNLEGYRAGLGSRLGQSCRYDGEAFGNACWKTGGTLFPGARCDGWILFEVPQSFALSNHTLTVTAGRAVAQWLLGRERESPRS